MEKCDNNFDVDELTKKIDNDDALFSVDEIDRLINEIDDHLSSLKENEDKIDLDLDLLTKEINDKLDLLDEEPTDDNLEKTLYDLSEISNMIKETLNKVDKDKEKKRKKAMYCDMARKKNKNQRYYKNKKTTH